MTIRHNYSSSYAYTVIVIQSMWAVCHGDNYFNMFFMGLAVYLGDIRSKLDLLDTRETVHINDWS